MNNDEMIVCRNICLNFGEKIIFNNLDFEFHKNKTYVISGKNGIGKTTLLNIFAGYIQYRGEIIKNQTLSLDYLLQDNTLFSNMTVKNNLLLKYLIYSNNLDSFKDVCNNALNQFHILNLLDRKVELLSGGEYQKVRLSQMILQRPDIIMLDEPLSKIDKGDIKDICLTISQLFKDKFLIIVSHDGWYGDFISLKLADGKLIRSS